jgi:hypothetical protein
LLRIDCCTFSEKGYYTLSNTTGAANPSIMLSNRTSNFTGLHNGNTRETPVISHAKLWDIVSKVEFPPPVGFVVATMMIEAANNINCT